MRKVVFNTVFHQALYFLDILDFYVIIMDFKCEKRLSILNKRKPGLRYCKVALYQNKDLITITRPATTYFLLV